MKLLLPRHDALLLSMVLFDRSRDSSLVLTWTPLITCSNPSGCSPHLIRFSFLRLFFSNTILIQRGASRLSHDTMGGLLGEGVHPGPTAHLSQRVGMSGKHSKKILKVDVRRRPHFKKLIRLQIPLVGHNGLPMYISFPLPLALVCTMYIRMTYQVNNRLHIQPYTLRSMQLRVQYTHLHTEVYMTCTHGD